MSSPTLIRLPAEQWELVAEASSCQIAAEHCGDSPVPVRAVEHRGASYVVFSVMWGAYGSVPEPEIRAWKLWPLSLYDGATTTVYHDEEAIRAGLRQRGDHTGLIVSVGGTPMVCAQEVRFILGLPGTHPLSLAEAKDYDERQRRSGWRALWFNGKEPEWFSLHGHPVAVYRDHSTLHNDHAVLLWKAKNKIQELSIDDDVRLSTPEELQTAPSGATPGGQLALF
jgi:hypothetical protein